MPEKRYRLNPDSITQEDRQALAEWITSEPAPQFTMGPLVKEYEEKLAEWMGMKYAVSCNSGSSANLLMADALMDQERLFNKKVIVPSAAWSTSISPFMKLGFDPIICEADPDSWGLDPVHLEELLQKYKPATVMLVHVLGVPAKMNEILHLKEKYGFFLLEDNCAALGSSYHGRKAGTFGKMSTISTYYGHQFSTIEGGVVFTNDLGLYNSLLMLRNHGQPTHLDEKSKEKEFGKYNIRQFTNFIFFKAGYNLRPMEIQGFLGLRQLSRLDWMIEKRWNNHQLYKKILGDSFETQQYDKEDTVSSIHFGALARTSQQREKIILALEKEGISTRYFTAGNQGLHPYWFNQAPTDGKFLGIMACRLFDSGFFLPNHPYLKPSDIEFICQTVLKAS